MNSSSPHSQIGKILDCLTLAWWTRRDPKTNLASLNEMVSLLYLYDKKTQLSKLYPFNFRMGKGSVICRVCKVVVDALLNSNMISVVDTDIGKCMSFNNLDIVTLICQDPLNVTILDNMMSFNESLKVTEEEIRDLGVLCLLEEVFETTTLKKQQTLLSQFQNCSLETSYIQKLKTKLAIVQKGKNHD